MQSFFLNDPIFTEPNDASVMLTLENSITSRAMRRDDELAGNIGQDVIDELSEYELAALQYIYAKGSITVRELCSQLNRSVKIARPVLRGLVNKGVIVWHGSSPKDPSQHYTLK